LLQTTEGLHAANKLKNPHIEWRKQKMKVSIAAQTLSNSVADAIDFCREELNLNQFKGSKATTSFIRLIDSLFDVMNSKNLLAKGFKSPMRECNENIWKELFLTASEKLKKITDVSGRLLINSPRKTAFIGLLTNIQSFTFLFETLVKPKKLLFLLTYKASQDHVELFFCALRSRLGANNNPSTGEFKSAYKRLLLHHQIRGNKGNSIVQDDTSVLVFQKKNLKTFQSTQNDFSLQRKYGLSFKDDEHDYSLISHLPILSDFQEAVLEYIAGFAVKMVLKLLTCSTCLFAILEPNNNSTSKLLAVKDRGGLLRVGENVKAVCETAEKTIQKMMKISLGKIPFEKDISVGLTSSVLENVIEKYS
jgi:hypothetical protein